MKRQLITFALFSAAMLIQLLGANAWGADAAKNKKDSPAPVASPAPDDTGAQRVNEQNIKEKYWARGDESEIGVVQNRLYSKAHHFELSLLGGEDFTDPMLSVYTLGARFGYHFSEYFSVHLLGWKAFSGNSGTLNDLLTDKSPSQIGTAVNTNKPAWYLGSEAQWSLLYGKLSVVGKAIIHYDLHFMAGLGAMDTETGKDFEQHLGVGQQFFLGKKTFLNVDYRLMHYHEGIPQKVITTPGVYGSIVGYRENWSNVITIGVGFLFGGPKDSL